MHEELSHVSIQLAFIIFHLPNEGYNHGRGFDNQQLP